MKKKALAIITILAVLSVGTISVSYVNATDNEWQSVIYPRVYIEDTNVGGKNLAEAEELIHEEYTNKLLAKKIEVKVNDKIYTLDYNDIEAKYNTDEVIKTAFNYGKQGNFINRYKLIKGEANKEYELDFEYNPEPIDEFVDKIEAEVNKSPKNAEIYISNGNIKITPGVNGASLHKDKLKQAIISQINGELEQEAIEIEGKLGKVEPEITKEKLSAINTPIATSSTSFYTSTANRINNIELSTKAINGTLLMPGESFSFNETVGERTKARGYKAAGVIVNGQIESGLGGGICQVSSTLYHAILHTDLKVDERRNHSLPLAYIGKGLDATVDWGNIDLRFTNTLDKPIYIEGYTKDKRVYFNIYSDETFTKRSYEMATEVSVVQPTIKYRDDANRLEGENVVVKNPSNGYRVKVYRKTFENGKLIDTEAISNDYYRPVNGEIIRGTKTK